LKSYASSQADPVLKLQNDYFGKDIASLLAPIINVYVEPYKGDPYFLI
jgi:hypothetical protein